MIIFGAGMAGCLAGVLNPSAKIFEIDSGIPDYHKAVLRFRDSKIGDLTGIKFKEVKVIKGIYINGKFEQPNIRLNNLYSLKVTGKILNRSIINTDTVIRYVAPVDFHKLLFDLCKDRVIFNINICGITKDQIHFFDKNNGCRLDFINRRYNLGNVVISTIPMNIVEKILFESKVENCGLHENPIKDCDFNFKSISIRRSKIYDCDINQTVYYPDLDFRVYRATITGDQLMIEYIPNESIPLLTDGEIDEVFNSFGIDRRSSEEKYHYCDQKYGKISPINELARRKFMLDMTVNLSIYSLGRYACWRNILLDDVYNDIYSIKNMIERDNYYNHLKAFKEIS